MRREAARQAEAARTEAEAASSAKDVFLATLSHELRQPLGSILGWMRLLQRDDVDAPGRGHIFERLERSVHSLTRLIDDLLDVSSIVTGKMRLNLQPLDLRQPIETALDSVRAAATAKGIELQLVVDPRTPPIVGDRGPPATGHLESSVECGEVHAGWWTRRRPACPRQRADRHRGDRLRAGHHAGIHAAALRALHAGGAGAETGGAGTGSRPGHRSPSRRAARRNDHGPEPRGRSGLDVHRGSARGDARPRGLDAPRARAGLSRVRKSPVATCSSCGKSYRLWQLRADSMTGKPHACPGCRADLTASIREHLLSCETAVILRSEALRARAHEGSEAPGPRAVAVAVR